MRATAPNALIVGGGISGLATAISLGRQGWRCTVLERDPERRRPGQGLLLPPCGHRSLQRLGLQKVDSFSAPIHTYELCQRNGAVLQQFAIRDALSVLHQDLLTALARALPAGTQLQQGRCLKLEAGTAGGWAVIDDRQQRWQADLIVAADGVGSVCRRHLFPQAQLTAQRTSELVLRTQAPELVATLQQCCRKFQDHRAGLALGLLPCRDGQLVVFAQFASARHTPCDGPQAAALLRRCFGGWNDQLDALLNGLDTRNAHLWHTTDLDPLPQLDAGNLVLVGDSAHPLLTVTSQGAAAALDDALVLAEALADVPRNAPEALSSALAHYSSARLPVVAELVAAGRTKQGQFLDPHPCIGPKGAPLVGFGLEAPLAG